MHVLPDDDLPEAAEADIEDLGELLFGQISHQAAGDARLRQVATGNDGDVLKRSISSSPLPPPLSIPARTWH